MAFSINLEKIAENDKEVKYKFYSNDEVGEYILNKNTYDVTIVTAMPSDKNGQILKRAVMRIVLLIRSGEKCPDKTFWAS